jgi:hypothetical protein
VGTSHVLSLVDLPLKASGAPPTLFPVKPGDLLVRAGAVLFAIGAAAVLAILVPFFFLDVHDLPTALSLVALLLPVGLGLALLGLLVGARRE